MGLSWSVIALLAIVVLLGLQGLHTIRRERRNEEAQAWARNLVTLLARLVEESHCPFTVLEKKEGDYRGQQLTTLHGHGHHVRHTECGTSVGFSILDSPPNGRSLSVWWSSDGSLGWLVHVGHRPISLEKPTEAEQERLTTIHRSILRAIATTAETRVVRASNSGLLPSGAA